uniref:Cadherin domain-containing protein n=1 Tax=Cyprinus carpio TaxID=7962 RepID=A0A8C1VEA0_CYPCA
LDREEKTSYQLQVTATDGGGLRSNTQAIVTVTVVDTQDNPPVFSQKEYSFVMFENVAVDTIIGTVTGEALVNITVKDLNDNAPHFIHNVEHVSAVENWATGHQIFQAKASDPDEGTNGVVKYSLKQNPKGLFHIHERHGLITLTGPLEVTTSSYQRTSSLILTIIFDQLSYEVTILESEPVNSRFFKVEASDKDSGLNGEIVYDIVSGNTNDTPRGGHFRIDPTSGVIITNKEIDREFSNLFELTIKATDQAVPVEFRRFALKNVTIWVTDQNDNIPVFISQNALVAESNIVIGSILTTVVAFDPDEGANGEVEYELLRGDSDTFIMDRYSGDIRLASQLVPSKLIYSLTVSATDHGTDRKTSRTELTIILQGSDGPVFSQPKYITILKEGQPPGTNVISLDASSPRGTGTKVEFFIVSVRSGGKAAGRLFTIGRHSGMIQTAAELDREQGSDLYLIDVYAIEADASQPRTQHAEVSKFFLGRCQ